MPVYMLILIGLGATFASWALLTLMGGERTRRMHDVRAQQAKGATLAKVISVSAPVVGVAQPAPKANGPGPASGKSTPAKPQAAGAGKNTR